MPALPEPKPLTAPVVVTDTNPFPPSDSLRMLMPWPACAVTVAALTMVTDPLFVASMPTPWAPETSPSAVIINLPLPFFACKPYLPPVTPCAMMVRLDAEASLMALMPDVIEPVAMTSPAAIIVKSPPLSFFA